MLKRTQITEETYVKRRNDYEKTLPGSLDRS